LDGSLAEKLLRALGSALEKTDVERVDILICGSIALILQSIINRRTRDIDGVAFVVLRDGELLPGSPLPEPAFRQAMEQVATVHNVQRNWLSFQSRSLIDDGLPPGIIERAVVREFGSKLTIRLVSRRDMVFLKMKAAASRGEPDISDLTELKATAEEAQAGFQWCLEQGYPRADLINVLENIGHGDLAKRLA